MKHITTVSFDGKLYPDLLISLHGESGFINVFYRRQLSWDKAFIPALIHVLAGLFPPPELCVSTGLASLASKGTGTGRCGCTAHLHSSAAGTNKHCHRTRQTVWAGCVLNDNCKTCLTTLADPLRHKTRLPCLNDLLSREACSAWSRCKAICLC